MHAQCVSLQIVLWENQWFHPGISDQKGIIVHIITNSEILVWLWKGLGNWEMEKKSPPDSNCPCFYPELLQQCLLLHGSLPLPLNPHIHDLLILHDGCRCRQPVPGCQGQDRHGAVRLRWPRPPDDWIPTGPHCPGLRHCRQHSQVRRTQQHIQIQIV